MLILSEEQCAGIDEREDGDVVRDTAKKLKETFPGINEADNTLLPRLENALRYADTIGLQDRHVRRDFLLLEAFWPGFYLQPEVSQWLTTPNGYSVDQRLEDYRHVMINRERRVK